MHQQSSETQPMLAQPNTMAAHVAKLRDQASQMSMTMDYIFFAAGTCVFAAAILSVISVALTEFAPFELVDSVYLVVFGMMMMIMDAPVRFKGLLEAQAFLGKYFKFLNRFVGRGVWYIFLGTMVFATLWDNQIWMFGAIVLGFFVFGVGVCSTGLGIMKSNKLDRVRQLVKKQNANSEQVFTSFARANPAQGMTSDELNVLCGQVAGVTFRSDEMQFVMNALDNEGRGTITLRDFHDWVASPYPTML